MSSPILSLRGVNKSFGPVHVLKDVNFDIAAGKVTALVGDNGAGKSTLIKCIAGIYTPETGDFHFEGNKVDINGPRDATALGIEIVYQDLALCDNLDIVHNMFLGREQKRGPVLNETSMEALARKTLDGLSVRTVKSIRQTVSSLSGGQRQTVAIARAVLWNSKIVILVLNLVRRLADNGLAVVLISHNLNDVFEVADNIAALYLGNMAAQVDKNEVIPRQVIELITTGKSAGVQAPVANKGAK